MHRELSERQRVARVAGAPTSAKSAPCPPAVIPAADRGIRHPMARPVSRLGVVRRCVVALAAFFLSVSIASAQQQVRVPLPPGAGAVQIAATFRPVAPRPAPAVVILHGCGGIGQNHSRMAQRLAQQGYATLLLDSFSSRGIVDACTRNWPTPADAERRAHDIDGALGWLAARPDISADRIAVMGYSYGGGVLLLRALQRTGAPAPAGPRMRAAIAVYPDCALAAEGRVTLAQPLLMTMAERDDWTPVSQCTALLSRLAGGRELVQAAVYPGAHHSFDAVGLPVRYLAAAGNRTKPNNCCGAHYGHHEPAYRQFLVDVDAFLARHLGAAAR
jgi:dienelactone hydrolase